VPAVDIPLSFISISGLRGKGLSSLFLAPLRLVLAVFQAVFVMLRVKPHLVVGMGGFVAGPGGLAAWLMRKPLIIHEQNAIAGYTNRVLSIFSKRVLEAFPKTFKISKKLFISQCDLVHFKTTTNSFKLFKSTGNRLIRHAELRCNSNRSQCICDVMLARQV